MAELGTAILGHSKAIFQAFEREGGDVTMG